eukprot:gene21584-24474_t
MINLSIGRQYAQAKLQEIDSYFKKMGSEKSSSDLVATSKLVELNSTQLQISQTYERKRSVLDIPDEDLKGKRVLLRCNLDVPVQDGNITEDYALRQSLPTIQHLTDRGAKVIIAGHRGHPTGEGYEAQYSLSPVAARLGELLNQSVAILPNCAVETMGRAVSALPEGSVVVLENLRFHTEETQNNADYARNLTAHVDIFVNDDFSSSHLALASTQGVARLVSTAVTGLALKKDLDMFHVSWLNFSTPLVGVVSVGNLTTQASFLENLLKMKPDRVILTGPIAVPFQHARGDSVGNETVVAEEVELAYHLDKRSTDQSLGISLFPEYRNTTFPWMIDATNGNGTLLWAGAEESRPEVPFLRAMTRGINHTFSSYDNALEMFKGNALPGVLLVVTAALLCSRVDTTSAPTRTPTARPTNRPTFNPTAKPTINPTAKPTANPTKTPTANPSANP